MQIEIFLLTYAKMALMFEVRKLDLLIAIYIFCITASELMGAKTFPILKSPLVLNGSVAIFLLPIVFTINDIITEVYGKERTRSIIRCGLLTVFLVLICSVFFTWLPPSTRYQSSEKAYDQIFNFSARIAAASLIAFTLAEFTDVLVFVKIRQKLGQKALWFRNNLSNFVSQFLDTAIFISLAFYAFDRPLAANLPFLSSLILPYWFLKCCMSVIETPFVYLGTRWLRKGG